MSDQPTFTHLDSNGEIYMVDISGKKPVWRKAIAQGSIELSAPTIERIQQNRIEKGNVLSIAKIAGINAVKRTSDVIPLCHSILLDHIDMSFSIKSFQIDVLCTVIAREKTGVEMEALHGVSIALLTIYDMCKAIDKNMRINALFLVEKIKQE